MWGSDPPGSLAPERRKTKKCRSRNFLEETKRFGWRFSTLCDARIFSYISLLPLVPLYIIRDFRWLLALITHGIFDQIYHTGNTLYKKMFIWRNFFSIDEKWNILKCIMTLKIVSFLNVTQTFYKYMAFINPPKYISI